jgi:putative heme iron utilization protein
MFGNVRNALFADDVSRLLSLAVIVSRKRSERVELNLLHLLNTEPNHAAKFRLFLDTVKHQLPQRLIDQFPGKTRDEIWNIKEEWWKNILPELCYENSH